MWKEKEGEKVFGGEIRLDFGERSEKKEEFFSSAEEKRYVLLCLCICD